MTKELITMYGDQQIHILWTLIIVQAVIILFLVSRSWKRTVSVPIGFNVKLIRESGNMLVYGLTVGPVVDGDVVERRVTIEVNGVLVDTKTFPPTATDLGELGFDEGVNVNIALVDVDDAGNVSEPAFLRFTTADTIPPAVPGGFSVALLREVNPVPAPEPEPAPEPAQEVLPDPIDMDVAVPVPEPAPEPEPTPEGEPPLSE